MSKMILVDKQWLIRSYIGLDTLQCSLISCLRLQVGTNSMFQCDWCGVRHSRKKRGEDRLTQDRGVVEQATPEVHLTVRLEHAADLLQGAAEVQHMIERSCQNDDIERTLPKGQHFCQSDQQ